MSTTERVPSKASITGMAVITAALAGVAVWMVLGMSTGRELAGFFLALTLFAVSLGATLERHVKRAEHRDREAKRAIEQNTENTGVWSRGPGEVVMVTFDVSAGVYRMTDGRGTWKIWDDLDALHAHLTGLEDAGWTTAGDVGTRLIRAALDLPGWEYAP